jgi:hypothetical protein
MRYLLILTLILNPILAYSEPTVDLRQKDYLHFYLGDYKLKLHFLEKGKRVKPKEELTCLDDFDYVKLYDHVFDEEVVCNERIESEKATRIRICDDSIKMIRKSHAAELTLCNTQKDKAINDYASLNTSFEDLKLAHAKELRTHYFIEGGAALLVVGLIGAIVKISISK